MLEETRLHFLTFCPGGHLPAIMESRLVQQVGP